MRIGDIERVGEREIQMPTFRPPQPEEPAPSSPAPQRESEPRESVIACTRDALACRRVPIALRAHCSALHERHFRASPVLPHTRLTETWARSSQ
jgi:hypothetical protein